MCVWGIGFPFDHPIWQNLPPCNCGASVPSTTSEPWVPTYRQTVRFEDFGIRIEPEPVIVAPPLPPARGRRARPKRYEAPTR